MKQKDLMAMKSFTHFQRKVSLCILTISLWSIPHSKNGCLSEGTLDRLEVKTFLKISGHGVSLGCGVAMFCRNIENR